MDSIFFLDIGFGFRVALKDVYCLLPMEVKTVHELSKEYRRANKLLRATRGRKGQTLILLNNGTAIVSALKVVNLEDNYREKKLKERYDG